MKSIRIFLMLASSLAVLSCAEELQEGVKQPAVEGAVMTKVINTPADSEDGSLLVCISEEAAAAIESGDASLAETISEGIAMTSFEPLFPDASKDEVAKEYRLHRWYEIRFEDADKMNVAALLSARAEVTKVEFNKIVVPACDLSFSPYVPSASEFSDLSMPFNDPMLPSQWHYINTGSASVSNSAVEGADIGVKDAWKLTGGNPDVIVAVIDSPVKYDHPDLAANMWVNMAEKNGVAGVDDDGNGYKDDVYGWNCVDNNADIDWSGRKASGHGTHVAGVVAAVNGNGTGVCGVAGGTGNGDGVRIMSCQIFKGDQTNLSSSSLAFYYAARNGASVAQCSWGLIGGNFNSDEEYAGLYSAEYAAIDFFLDKRNNNSEILDGNIIIAAAGNERNPFSSYPAGLENVVSVTGIGPDYLPAVNYTNYGPGCNIAAPGGDFYVGDITAIENNKSRVLSTFIDTVVDDNLGTSGHEYAYMQGTSMACPHVSGVAALGLSYAYKLNKTFTREEFISMLLTSVNDIEDVNESFVDGFKKFYIENGKYNYVDLGIYRDGKMGTGVIDAWKFLMNIEGTPSIMVSVLDEGDKAKRYDLTGFFGGGASDLTYLSVECDAETKAALGLSDDPSSLEIKYGKLSIKPTKAGSGKITVKALAGYDEDGKADGNVQSGAMEISRTISVMARGAASKNNGWL